MNSEEEIVFYGVYQGCVPGVYTSVSIVKKIPSGECRKFKNFENACYFAATGKIKSPESFEVNADNKMVVKNENSPKDEQSSTVQDSIIENQLREMKKLAQEVAAWKEKKKEFKEMSLRAAMHAKSLFDSKDFVSREAIKKESADALQSLTEDLIDLVHTTKDLED